MVRHHFADEKSKIATWVHARRIQKSKHRRRRKAVAALT
jgi:hypothetical protein